MTADPGYVFWVAHGMLRINEDDDDDPNARAIVKAIYDELAANNWRIGRTGNKLALIWWTNHPLNGQQNHDTIRDACQHAIQWDGDKFGEPPYELKVTP